MAKFEVRYETPTRKNQPWMPVEKVKVPEEVQQLLETRSYTEVRLVDRVVASSENSEGLIAYRKAVEPLPSAPELVRLLTVESELAAPVAKRVVKVLRDNNFMP